MNINFVSHLDAVDRIAAVIENGTHWLIAPFTPDTGDLLLGLQLHYLTDVTLWIQTDPEDVLCITDVPASFATVLATLFAEIGPAFTWVAASPKGTNTRASLLAATGTGSAAEAEDEARDLVAVATPTAQTTAIPTLWLDALQRVDPNSAEYLLDLLKAAQ